MERIYKFSIESKSDRISCEDYGTHDQMMNLYEKTVKQFKEHYLKHPYEYKKRVGVKYDDDCSVTKYTTVDDEVVITFYNVHMYEDGYDFSEVIEYYLQNKEG